MGRLSRMFLFASNTAILLIGLAAGIYCYTVALTSGSILRDLFPSALLIGLGLLAIGLIVASVLGCYTGYQQSIISLMVYSVFLTVLLIGQLLVGWSAYNESLRAQAILSNFWTSASTSQLENIQSTFGCCGHSMLKKQAECPENYSGTCDAVIPGSLFILFQSIAISSWILAIVPLASVFVSVKLIRSIRKSNRPQRSKYIIPQ